MPADIGASRIAGRTFVEALAAPRRVRGCADAVPNVLLPLAAAVDFQQIPRIFPRQPMPEAGMGALARCRHWHLKVTKVRTENGL